MYIHIRSLDGLNTTITVSKFISVQELKELVQNKLNVNASKQRLFFRGKQLENEHNLCEYNVNVNDVIQLMVRTDVEDCVTGDADEGKHEICNESGHSKECNKIECDSPYFKVGDIVDVKDSCFGAWFEGKLVGIHKNSNGNQSHLENGNLINKDDLSYTVLLNKYPYSNPITVELKGIRPRSRYRIPIDSVKEGDLVMVNYNPDRKRDRGFWYDFSVTSVSVNKTIRSITGNVYFGSENNVLNGCKIKFIDDIMKIEKLKLINERSEQEQLIMQSETDKPRVIAPFCDRCKDKPSKCMFCSCHVCGLKTSPEKQVMCDECNMAYHIWCLSPPLEKVPETDEWFCNECRNDKSEIIKAGEKLKKVKINKGKINKIGNKGRGMACVGRKKDCTIVPSNYFGPIPGIEVGTTWKFRMQVAEAGVHRPHVAGIHGRENHGAYSIVLSGGYEDDIDKGDEIIYTGSGGRDLAGRRTAAQSCDQMLTKLNKALALNCNASFNQNEGAEAENWREGKPVRVIRNFRGAKHSKYSPVEGNRYDGLYKVVKYYPDKGKAGFLVWRFLLRRDDPVPAPWSKEGKKRIERLGIQIIYPDGYLSAIESTNKENLPKKKRRGCIVGVFPAKRPKLVAYELEENVKKEIENDEENSKLWEVIMSSLHQGKQVFLSKVEEEFTCICCHDLIYKPVTMPCHHNICFSCLKRSFEAKIYECPYCRHKLHKNYNFIENKALHNVLTLLYPGYSSGR